MDEEQGFDIDPEMAAQMGFASFGTQPTAKKRKYVHNDAVVGGAPTVQQERKTGANTTELGIRNRGADGAAGHPDDLTQTARPAAFPIQHGAETEQGHQAGGASRAPDAAPPDSFLAHLDGKTAADLSGSELERLAKGLRTAGGDIAYFKPSFISDPWAHLRNGK